MAEHRVHRYYIKIPTGNNKFKYFYSAEEYNAYRRGKDPGVGDSEQKKAKKQKSSKNGRRIPEGHMAPSNPGSIIRGYQPGVKPGYMSDEQWEYYQKLWNTTYVADKDLPRQAAPQKKSKLAMRFKIKAKKKAAYTAVRRSAASRPAVSSAPAKPTSSATKIVGSLRKTSNTPVKKPETKSNVGVLRKKTTGSFRKVSNTA